MNNCVNDILYQTSPIWKRIEKQSDDSITDFVMLFTYKVSRKDRPNNYSPILTEGEHFVRLNEKGKTIESFIKEATLRYCQIDWYSINENKVGNERSCNHISFIVFAHWKTSCSIEETMRRMREDVKVALEKPINELLDNYNAILTPSAYDHHSRIYSWDDRDELLVGDRMCRYTKGHF